tara:strand:- start:1832 stop:2674 length:843 start_codon:yes stop_codon:yes gene_type:complete
VPAPIPKKISQILPKFQNVAQTSHYLVKFGLPSSGGLRSHLQDKGIDFRFSGEDVGLLCSSAVLPGSSMATVAVTGEYQGLVEMIPHTRNFTRIKLEFYVDNRYKSLKFLEHWMEFITGGSSAGSIDDAYHFKLNYPEHYRSESTKIIKFEKNYNQFLEYNFRGLYPINLQSTKVTYKNSQVLKATCEFSYERYICGEASSASEAAGTDKNNSLSRFGAKMGAVTVINNEVTKELQTSVKTSMANPIVDTDGTSPFSWRTSEDTATSFPVVDGEVYYGDA